jgi:hypothetical protein
MKIDIEIKSELTINDGIIFDTQLTQDAEVAFAPRPRATQNPAAIVEPFDAYNVTENIRALPPGRRPGAWAAVIAAAALFGLKAMTGFARSRLRHYMSMELHKLPARIRPGDEVDISRIIRGTSHMDLHNLVLRVVAANFEMGQYVRGHGKGRRTESFSEPARAVVLYEGFIKRLPAGTPLESVVHGPIHFDAMFSSLYPPQILGWNHGLTLHWEIQLIHKDYVDQELVGPWEVFEWRDFVTP